MGDGAKAVSVALDMKEGEKTQRETEIDIFLGLLNGAKVRLPPQERRLPYFLVG